MDSDTETQVRNRGLELQQSLLFEDTSVPSVKINLRDRNCFDKDKVLYPPRNSVDFFVPYKKIVEKISLYSVAESVASDHQDYTSEQVQELSAMITRSYARVYAILAYIGKTADIRIFTRVEVDDSKLPLAVSSDHQRLKYTVPMNTRATLALTPRWQQRDVEDFFRHQFSFISPFFTRPADGGLLHYRLSHNDVLPIIEESSWIPDQTFDLEHIIFPSPQFSSESGTESQNSSTSTSSPEEQVSSPAKNSPYTVKQIKLHKSHHTFGDHGFESSAQISNRYALKGFFVFQRALFMQELSFLRRINKIKHTHLNKLMVSFEIDQVVGGGPSFFLIFPWAEMDLAQYWETKETCDLDWMMRQCAGLSSALACIHEDEDGHASIDPEDRLYGRHGDLKPKNILWFPHHPKDSKGILALSDFGLSKHSRLRSRSNGDPRQLWIAETRRPPEVFGGLLTRKFDLWCLGTVFLDFVVWYLKGYMAVLVDFPRARTARLEDPNWPERKVSDDSFCGLDGNRAYLKQAVVTWIEDLRGDGRCKPVLSQMLDFILSGMLVVDPAERWSARCLATRLEELPVV